MEDLYLTGYNTLLEKWVLSQAINCWDEINGLENRRIFLNDLREQFFLERENKDLFLFLQAEFIDDMSATIETMLPKTVKNGLLDLFLDITNIPISATPINFNIQKIKQKFWQHESSIALEENDKERFLKSENELKKINSENVDAVYSEKDIDSEITLGTEKGIDFEIYSTFIDGLNDYFKMVKKQTTVLTGIPGSGKSNFADQIAVNMAWKHDWKVLMFSPENQPIRLHLMNIARKWSGNPVMATGKKIDNKWITGHFTFINTNEIEHNIDLIIDIVDKERPDLFILDPWNEVLITKEPETHFISESLSKLKSMSYRCNCHVIIIAHPTKLKVADKGTYKGDYPPVSAYDISGSAMWYSKPDNILSLWRSKSENKIEIHIQKIKYEGITGHRGKHTMKFLKETGGYGL